MGKGNETYIIAIAADDLGDNEESSEVADEDAVEDGDDKEGDDPLAAGEACEDGVSILAGGDELGQLEVGKIDHFD